jgi:periplasmic protein TonB
MEAKKNPKIDLSRKSGLFLNIGFVVSLLLVIAAFEWKSYDRGDLLDLGQVNDDFEEMTEIPLTQQPPPPPPKIKQPEIIEVPDEEEIEEEIEVDLDVEITEDTEIAEIVFEEPIEEEETDKIFQIVENPATFKGGIGAFYQYVQKNMKYPSQAQRMGLEGKVFVQFVVGKDGKITDVEVLRGIGAGCDEEAIRVLKNSPAWSPGKQRGRPVRQRMVLPITFKLN